jgi:hypothetical protein
MSGSLKKYETPEELQEAIDKYFANCNEEDIPYTVEGLTLALGFCDRSSLLDYEKEEGYEAHFHTVKKAKLTILNNKLTKAMKNKLNPTIVIFDLKNNHGFKDKQEIETKPSVNLLKIL